ncbi:MAG TPA: CusA/CzcA family heavy metal efflux RND transporter [Gemmatimonadales bacterium]|nr:CusA/CzcA family heavy metal efflux RND transporter [Gemmatimonadales bacterium]
MIIERLVAGSVRRRGLVFTGIAALLAAGIWALSTLPFEAFPDLTANSVSIIAEAPGMAPQDIEQQVTFQIERSMLGLPRTIAVRSTSKFGLSLTQVVFDDGVDAYFARQLVTQRLGEVLGNLPPGVTANLGPIATAMGEVYQYVLVASTPEHDAISLKTLQDWTIAPQLRTVPGVTEVNSWGGYTERIDVITDPRRLAEAGLTLADLDLALQRENANFGGLAVESRGERFVVHGVGQLASIEELRRVPLRVEGGVPLRLGDIATIARGALPRSGAVTAGGRGEVVSGMVIMQKGENARLVMSRIRERVATIEATLPPGVALVPFYDQSALVDRTTHTIEKNLLLGGALVVAVLWLFLRSVAAALLVALVIPLSMLWAFVAMRLFGVSANLMSLGALDFGLLVDGSVVMVENIMRRGARAGTSESLAERIRRTGIEVGRPVVFGIAIIIAVYLPIFALEGTERRMFVPMAFTVMAAVLGSLVLALTFIPAGARTVLGRTTERHWEAFERLRARYERVVAATLRRPRPVIVTAVVLFVVAMAGATTLGSEFMPRLDEGAILLQARRPASTSLEEGVRYSTRMEIALRDFPEVETIVSKLGRPELATEAMGTYESDTYVILTPHDRWRPGGKDALIARMDSALKHIPGLDVAFTQPIQMRLDEAETGITTDVGVKLFGSDVDTLAALAARIEALVGGVAGAEDLKTAAATRVKQLRVAVRRDLIAGTGLGSADVGDAVQRALGAVTATELIEGARRIPIAVQVAGAARIDADRFEQVPIALPGGGITPLGALADIDAVLAPEAYVHEGGLRMVVVGANIRGRDVGSFVADAERVLASNLTLPTGYYTEWGGQYRHQQTALARLKILVPVAIAAILALLIVAFGTMRHAVIILLNVPFALVGGIASLWLTGLNLSLSASIGFIALFGIAVLNGVVLLTAINDAVRAGRPLVDAVIIGAGSRLRPVLMTASVAGLGFVPMAISRSAGAELQRPLATVVIGGLITSTLLTLVVLPTIYRVVESRFMVRAAE